MIIFITIWILSGILGFTILALTEYEKDQPIAVTLLHIIGFIISIIGGGIMLTIALIILLNKWLEDDDLGYFEEVLFLLGKDKKD